MGRPTKKKINEELLHVPDPITQDLENDYETPDEETEDVEETQELSFGDDSYNRLGEISELDEWN